MTQSPIAKDYYTIKQIAEMKGISKEAVASWIKEKKKLTTEVFNKMILIPRTEKNEAEIKSYNPKSYRRK